MMRDEGEIYKITHHMFRSEKIAQWRVLLCVQVRPTLLSVAELWIFNWNFKGFVKKKPASWSVVNSFHRKFIWTTVKFRVDKISFSIQPHMFLFPHYDNRNVIPILLFFDFFSAPFRDIIAWHNWTKVYINAFTKDLNYMYMFF